MITINMFLASLIDKTLKTKRGTSTFSLLKMNITGCFPPKCRWKIVHLLADMIFMKMTKKSNYRPKCGPELIVDVKQLI